MAFPMVRNCMKSSGQSIIKKILREYEKTGAGSISHLMERELRVPVTESACNTFCFTGSHFIDVSIDEYLEGIPVNFSVTVAASPHGGYEATLSCQTNLDEPEYAHWEFRDFLNKLSEGGYIGFFRLHENRLSNSDIRNCMLYEYTFPVPADGDISESTIECVVSRFLNDVSRAATFYFESFFYPFTSHSDGTMHGNSTGMQGMKCSSASKVILFPLNRRSKKC